MNYRLSWVLLLVPALALAGLVAAARADVDERMRALFQAVGGYGSIDEPAMLNAQSRHVFSGGGLVFRAPQRNYNLFSARGPSLRAGCGGIDLYAGSFSFINKDEFVQMLRNIAANSLGLAFKTALCSTSANLCQAIEDLQKTLESLNRFNIDSCESAKALVGGFMGSSERARASACMGAGRVAGLFADASEARSGCARQDSFAQARAAARSSDEESHQPLEFAGGNLSWQALTKVAGGLEQRDREFLMSMLGTHVVVTTTLALQHFPPTITRVADLHERELILLTCDEPVECLDVSTTEVVLPRTFLEMARDLIIGVRQKMLTGERLNARELAFATAAPVPLLAVAQADAAGAHGLSEIAAEAIAYALAHHFLSDALRSAAAASAAWRSRSAAEADLVRQLLAGTRSLRSDLAQEMHTALAQVNTRLETSAQLRDLRSRLISDELSRAAQQPP